MNDKNNLSSIRDITSKGSLYSSPTKVHDNEEESPNVTNNGFGVEGETVENAVTANGGSRNHQLKIQHIIQDQSIREDGIHINSFRSSYKNQAMYPSFNNSSNINHNDGTHIYASLNEQRNSPITPSNLYEMSQLIEFPSYLP